MKNKKKPDVSEDQIIQWLEANDPSLNKEYPKYIEVEEEYLNGRWNRKETMRRFKRIKL